MLRVVFMGSDAIALPALNWFLGAGKAGAKLVGVFTQPDRAAGRGQKIQSNEIKLWAQAHGLPLLQPDKIGATERAQLAALRPDITLVLAYGHILKQDFIVAPRLGTFNLHTSLLPQYRGASPIQSAITAGDTVTGVTLMRMVLQLDAGPVADTERVGIAPLDTAAEVEGKLAQACVALLARGLPAIAAGTLTLVEQNHAQATFCRRLEKADGVLDFSQPAARLAARINGLMPWPGCATEINGQTVKLGLADVCLPLDCKPAEAGTVSGADKEGLLVSTGQGILRLRMLQRPGGKMLRAAEFLRGWPVAPGTRLPSHPLPRLVAEAPFLRPKG